jgi:hypothetical protein
LAAEPAHERGRALDMDVREIAPEDVLRSVSLQTTEAS